MTPPTKPPKPPQPRQLPSGTTLSSLTPSIRVSLHAIVLGIEGPREVTLRATSRKTLVTNLLLCDETHQGRRLSLWGQSALRVTHLRILDIVHIARVSLHVSEELRLQGDGHLTRVVPANDTDANLNIRGNRVAELLAFRTDRFPELCAMAERGRLLAREWGNDQSSVQRRRLDGEMDTSDTKEFENVRISCVRIRVSRGCERSNVSAVRALCRRVCQRCSKRLPRGENGNNGDGEVRCPCGGATSWGFGWLLLGLRGSDIRGIGSCVQGERGGGNDPVFVVVEGEALGRLLFGVDVQRIVQDTAVAEACYDMLETLATDPGTFRVVLRVGTARPRLLDLQV